MQDTNHILLPEKFGMDTQTQVYTSKCLLQVAIDSAMGLWVIDKPFKHQDLGGFIPPKLSLSIPASLDRGVSNKLYILTGQPIDGLGINLLAN
ncbi:MAG: hypothetical protein WCD53_31695 [Microcoleus sp.]